MTRRIASRLAVALTAGALLAACGVARVVTPTPDDFAKWSTRPLPPDPALAALAIAPISACRVADDPTMPQILLQDRRTEATALFLVTGQARFGSCIVSKSGGASGGGSGPLPEPMTGPLSIDDRGSGTAGDGLVTELGGRIAVAASEVVIELRDGTRVFASVGNGYWLAWWPSAAIPIRVSATDPTGSELAMLEVATP